MTQKSGHTRIACVYSTSEGGVSKKKERKKAPPKEKAPPKKAPAKAKAPQKKTPKRKTMK